MTTKRLITFGTLLISLVFLAGCAKQDERAGPPEAEIRNVIVESPSGNQAQVRGEESSVASMDRFFQGRFTGQLYDPTSDAASLSSQGGGQSQFGTDRSTDASGGSQPRGSAGAYSGLDSDGKRYDVVVDDGGDVQVIPREGNASSTQDGVQSHSSSSGPTDASLRSQMRGSIHVLRGQDGNGKKYDVAFFSDGSVRVFPRGGTAASSSSINSSGRSGTENAMDTSAVSSLHTLDRVLSGVDSNGKRYSVLLYNGGYVQVVPGDSDAASSSSRSSDMLGGTQSASSWWGSSSSIFSGFPSTLCGKGFVFGPILLQGEEPLAICIL